MSLKQSTRSSVSSSSKVRLSSCAFTFADGRRCRALPLSGHSPFCHFHARREAQARAAEQLGRDAGFFLSGGYVSACDLSAALGRLFAQAAAGNVKPRTTASLTYLAQVLVQTIRLAENEYIASFGSDAWRSIVSSHAKENAHYLNPQLAQRGGLAHGSGSAPPAAPSPSPVPNIKSAPPSAPTPSAQPPQSAHPAKDARPERAQRVEGPQRNVDAAKINMAPPAQACGELARPGEPATADPPRTSSEKPPAKSTSTSPVKQAAHPAKDARTERAQRVEGPQPAAAPPNPPAKESQPAAAEPPVSSPPPTTQESPRAYVEVGPCRLPIGASIPITWPWPPKPNSM